MQCKICSFKSKNNRSLARHLKFSHSISLIEYKIQYENFKPPKCSCGKNTKFKDGVKFHNTCGDLKCIKQLLREKRLKFMKENPEQTAWRTKNLSYPEKVFIKLLKKYKLDKKYLIIREKSFFPYFVDFAFEGVNVAVEIDGGQHELPERKESDDKKDKLLNTLGWRVFRVTAKEINLKGDDVISKIIKFIGSDIIFDKCGIEFSKSKKQLETETINLERENNNGLTIKEIDKNLLQRRVERPPYEQLKQEIKELGYVGTGKKYGVSDNGIRRWVKTYEKYKF